MRGKNGKSIILNNTFNFYSRFSAKFFVWNYVLSVEKFYEVTHHFITQ